MDDFAFSEHEEYFEDQPLFQSCVTSYFQLDNDFEFYDGNLIKPNCEQLKDTAQSQSPETQHSTDKIEEYYNQGLFKYVPREINRIELPNKKTKNQYIECKKGDKQETRELAINYKSIISGFLDQHQSYQQNPQVEALVNEFIQCDSNIASFRKLFGVIQNFQNHKHNSSKHDVEKIVSKKSDQIRKICLIKLSSKQIGYRILKSSRMHYQNKIKALKFLQVFRKGCIEPQNFNYWKQS